MNFLTALGLNLFAIAGNDSTNLSDSLGLNFWGFFWENFDDQEISVEAGLGIMGGGAIKPKKTVQCCWKKVDITVSGFVGFGWGGKIGVGRLFNLSAKVGGPRIQSSITITVSKNCDGSIVGGGRWEIASVNPGYFSAGFNVGFGVPNLLDFSFGGTFTSSISGGLYVNAQATPTAIFVSLTAEGEAKATVDYTMTMKLGKVKSKGKTGTYDLTRQSFSKELVSGTIRW